MAQIKPSASVIIMCNRVVKSSKDYNDTKISLQIGTTSSYHESQTVKTFVIVGFTSSSTKDVFQVGNNGGILSSSHFIYRGHVNLQTICQANQASCGHQQRVRTACLQAARRHTCTGVGMQKNLTNIPLLELIPVSGTKKRWYKYGD